MEVTKEYIVAPKLAHHLIALAVGGAIAGACAYMAVTNTSGIHTRRTNMSPDELNLFLWVLCGAGCFFVAIVLAEMIVTRMRPVATIRMTSTDIAIPMNSLIKRKTVTASYAQITEITVLNDAPNRFLRIYTTEGNATVAELNVGPGMFDEIYATLRQHAPYV